MASKIRLFFGIFLFFLLGFFFIKPASASAFTLSGNVKDSTNVLISGAIVDVKDLSNNEIGNATTDSQGNYNIPGINAGNYNITLTPPSGSNYSSVSAPNYSITTDTTLNFVLVPTGTVTLSGYLYDPTGVTLSNQTVTLGISGGSNTSVKTDSNGFYSIQVSPNTYNLSFAGTLADVPVSYNINSFVISLTQSRILNVTLPFNKVSLHVQDPSNNPVSGVQVSDSYKLVPVPSLGPGISNGSGYAQAAGGPTTDSLGNTYLWVLPNNSALPYSFTATPPSGSGFITTALTNQVITGDTSLTITLQTPVTLKGHIYDPLGNPLYNQTVSLQISGSFSTSVRTDSTGFYSLQVTPNTYTFGVAGGLTISPIGYNIYSFSINLTQDQTLDVTLPFKQVTVHVQDAAGNPITGATISNNYILLPVASLGTGISNGSGYTQATPSPSTDSSGNATLWLLPNISSLPYSFTATPPSGSGFQTATISNIVITGNTSLTITLTSPVTLQGHIYNPLGQALANQTVTLQIPNSTSVSTKTDSTGFYSLQVTSNTYNFSVAGNLTDVPENYNIFSFSLTLTQNQTLDVTLPFKKLSIHVQDPYGNPVSGVQVANSYILVPVASIGTNISTGTGFAQATPGPTTDSSGNAYIWVLPNDTALPYTITMTPSSIYAPFSLTNFVMTTDQTELISLQFAHTPPVTTETLSPTPYADGSYPNPTTVTLSATAATGYTIANTYYTIDGGTQQTYTAPFTVSGDGNHTITYWSIDNAGVYEAPNSKTFTIHTNLPPQISPLTGVTINEGDTYNENGSFTDADSTSWTATVDYGDGSGVQPLPLSGTTFPLSHKYLDNGTYTVTVTITDNQGAISTANATVTVLNVAPTVSNVTASTNPIAINTSITASASFTDPGILDTHTATINWGDGSVPTQAAVTEQNGSGTVSGSYAYPAAGVYEITITVTDKDGGVGIGTYRYLAVYDPSAGFVTGSGVIYSPAGAEIQFPSLTGDATFGISAKYVSGQTIPTGNTMYSFPNGGFDFASTSYDWLVVSGSTAFLHGQGTINGAGSYSFLVSVVDGSPDTLRMQITDNSTNTIIYDNQSGAASNATPTEAISHGQIKVH